MGNAYRKNWKHITGKPDITGYETLQLGASSLTAAGAETALPDAFGVATYVTPRPARLEGMNVDVNGTAVTSGSLTLRLKVNGTTVGTLTVDSTNPSGGQIVLAKEKLEDVLLAAGDIVQATRQVTTTLSSAQAVSARVMLANFEA
jgi:hypothetical protein